MGYYILNEGEAPNFNKAKLLVEEFLAELVLSPETFDFSGQDALVCVIENQNFDAAAIAYNATERDVFNDWTNDDRPRTWLKIPKALAIQLCPSVKDALV